MIPLDICNAVECLRNSQMELPRQAFDGRNDSAISERHIVQILQNKKIGVDIYSPNINQKTNRSWYDVKIGEYFCDIKVSNLSSNDNTNAKMAIYYFLTGENPEEVAVQEKPFFKAMKKNEKLCEDRDYYYIVVNKENTKDIFALSIKSISEVVSSPNNLPFQCKWDRCRAPTERTWTQAKEFLLKKWAESIARKIKNTEKGMPDYYPEYFNKKKS